MECFNLLALNPPSTTGNDFLDSFQLNVAFTESHVEQLRLYCDRERGLRNLVEVKQWKRIKELGRGGFGVVYLEEDSSGKQRAVKEVPKSMGKQKVIDPLREIIAMASFSKNEAHFVNLEGWFQSDTHLYIAMEYFEPGDLQKCLDTPLPEAAAQDITYQLNEAVSFMHSKGFTHRDLKPSNVFVVSKSPHWWVKLADFGISKRVQGDSTALHTHFDGSFMAPEILGFVVETNAGHYTKAVDCWALGCLTYWLITLQILIPRQQLLSFCNGWQRLSMIEISSNAKDYITSLVIADSRKRLTALEALSHPWVQLAPLVVAQKKENTMKALSSVAQRSLSFSGGCHSSPPLSSVDNISVEQLGSPQEHTQSMPTATHSVIRDGIFSVDVQDQLDVANRPPDIVLVTTIKLALAVLPLTVSAAKIEIENLRKVKTLEQNSERCDEQLDFFNELSDELSFLARNLVWTISGLPSSATAQTSLDSLTDQSQWTNDEFIQELRIALEPIEAKFTRILHQVLRSLEPIVRDRMLEIESLENQSKNEPLVNLKSFKQAMDKVEDPRVLHQRFRFSDDQHRRVKALHKIRRSGKRLDRLLCVEC